MKAIITGANDGIGRGMALALARRGVAVALMARRSDRLAAVAEECLAAGAPKAIWRSVDVTDRAASRKAMEGLDQDLGRANILVLNAGVGGDSRPHEDRSEAILRCLNVNLLAAVDAIEWAKPKWVTRALDHNQSFHIAAVSSVAGARGLNGFAGYSASKAGLHAYLEAVQAELKPCRVRVTDIAPGFIDTAMTQGNRFKMPFLMDADAAGEKFIRATLKGKPFYVAPFPYRIAFSLLRVIPSFIYRWAVTRSKPPKGIQPEPATAPSN